MYGAFIQIQATSESTEWIPASFNKLCCPLRVIFQKHWGWIINKARWFWNITQVIWQKGHYQTSLKLKYSGSVGNEKATETNHEVCEWGSRNIAHWNITQPFGSSCTMYKNHLKVMIEKRRSINKYVVPNTVWRILVLVEFRMTSAGCTRKYTAKSSNISCQC